MTELKMSPKESQRPYFILFFLKKITEFGSLATKSKEMTSGSRLLHSTISAFTEGCKGFRVSDKQFDVPVEIPCDIVLDDLWSSHEWLLISY